MGFPKIGYLLFIVSSMLVSCKSEIKKNETKAEGFISFENPTTGNTSLPRLFGTENQLFMSWVEKKDSISNLYYSAFKDGSWSKPFEVNSGKDWFINWADFPAIAENNGNIFISHLQKSANGKYTYDVKVNLYSLETNTWKKDILLHDDGTASEHGFVSVVPSGNTSFYAIWLDGRNTAGGHDHHENIESGAMTLRGRLIHADGTMQPDVELDSRVCDCCQTAMANVNGAPVLAYRDRGETEVRDIATIALLDDSFSSSKPVFNDNWEIPGCPVNGPAIASHKNSLAIAWFTGVGENPKVQVAFSNDRGKSFAAPILINSHETLGRVDVVMLSENTAIVSWMETISDDTFIQAMRVSADGTKGFPVTISKTSFERSSGFPQLELAGNTVYVAWTMVDGKKSSINTASIAVEDL